ncbi:G-protein coupled receptor Mth2-like [Centruroides vittatus]|uniref:G-protein coupled receptor Mth2-like n=1 Tax=Centruroides vittatus TaxID=120091 RepID=UPI00350EF35E
MKMKSVQTFLIIFPILSKLTQVVLSEEELTLNSTESLATKFYNYTEINAEKFGNFSEQFLSCLKTLIELEHFQILENETVYIPNYSFLSHRGLYSPADYYLTENGVYVCFPQIFIEEHKEDCYMQEILQIYTVVGFSLSVVCLFLHFVAFLFVPDMRNLPGKNIASLALSMFVANLIFMLGRIKFTSTWTCYPLGLAGYYFMMTSFFWINAISFNVFRSFRQATTKLRLTWKHAELKTFFFYSLYSWGIPALFLIVVITGEESAIFPEVLKPGFKSRLRICWFTRLLSMVVFFAIPIGLLIFINILFFVFSAHIILSNSMKLDNQNNGRKKKFVLYVKLAIIMGVGWIFGLLTYFISSVVIQFIMITVVTLQGAFIFVAFTRFSKTKTILLHRYHQFRKSMGSLSTCRSEELRSNSNKFSIPTTNYYSSSKIKY